MGHIPYGYKVVNSKIEIDEVAADNLKSMFEFYLSGASVLGSAQKAGMDFGRTSAKRMLLNEVYLGNDHYPQLIKKETFEAAAAEMKKRAALDTRKRYVKTTYIPEIQTSFFIPSMTGGFEDPYKQAEYAYSQIRPKEEK